MIFVLSMGPRTKCSPVTCIYIRIMNWSRSQSEICGLFLKFVSPPRKKNLVTDSGQGHASGIKKSMFY